MIQTSKTCIAASYFQYFSFTHHPRQKVRRAQLVIIDQPYCNATSSHDAPPPSQLTGSIARSSRVVAQPEQHAFGKQCETAT